MKIYSLDIIILDDGFQHRSIYRNLDIVLINSLDKIKDHKMLPAGFLREPIKNLQRADLIFFTKSNLIKMEKSYLLSIVKNFNIPYYFSTAHNRLINDCQNKDDFFHFLEKKKGYLISGIGDGLSFELSASIIGKNIIGHSSFRDHYGYKQSSLNKVIKKLKALSVDYILTTEKDYVRLENRIEELSFLGIETTFLSEQEKFNSIIRKQLR